MADALKLAGTSHLAGSAIRADVLTGEVTRQICQWCGQVLFEQHRAYGAVLYGAPWVTGKWVQRQGPAVVGYTPRPLSGHGAPENSCMAQELALKPAEELRV